MMYFPVDDQSEVATHNRTYRQTDHPYTYLTRYRYPERSSVELDVSWYYKYSDDFDVSYLVIFAVVEYVEAGAYISKNSTHYYLPDRLVASCRWQYKLMSGRCNLALAAGVTMCTSKWQAFGYKSVPSWKKNRQFKILK